jgi:hypothetical protein
VDRLSKIRKYQLFQHQWIQTEPPDQTMKSSLYGERSWAYVLIVELSRTMQAGKKAMLEAERYAKPMVMTRFRFSAVVALLSAVWMQQPAAPQAVDFPRDIRPILSDACFACHGPDDGLRKADLRLDTRDGLFEERDDYAIVVPGKPESSELFRRITSVDPLRRMPPPKSGKALSGEQIEWVRQWIDRGARWTEHWAFVPPQRPRVPSIKSTSLARNPIDAFVIDRLEREGLAPSAEADRTTLLRRVSLDLIGLPPSIEEIDAFLANRDAAAYEREVDRLLESPHFGERWGRNWLDAARYADSDGFEKDKPRQVSFYRDWVIGALNQDMPYDELIIEQIAGDMLPNPSQNQLVATGFLRNSMVNEEGGIDPEQFRMEAMFDRMEAIGKSILGLTIQCGQCHNHKYDPLTQVDYYRMFAFLNDCHEASISVYGPEDAARRTAILAEIDRLETDLRRRHPDWQERMAQWEMQIRCNQPEWMVVRPTIDDISTGGQKYLPQPDGSFLAQGYAPTKHRVKLTVQTNVKRITGIRLELLTDPNLPRGGPGRSIKGTCALTEFEVEAAPVETPAKAIKVKLARATADFEPAETPLEPVFDDRSGRRRTTGPVRFAIDGNDDTAWGIDAGPGQRNQDRNAVFVLERPIDFPNGTMLVIYLKQNHGGWNSDDNQNHNLGRFRLSITTHPEPSADTLPRTVRNIVAKPADRRTSEDTAAVFRFFLTTVPEWREVSQRIESLWREHPEGASQLVLRTREEPRPTHVLSRGDFLKPSEKAEPGTPTFLHPLPPGPTNRLTFAKWLADRRSPTTARVIVNRIWQACFGIGLVSSSEDFGSQGEAPSHPELLDWLAVEFMDHGWSLKALHRLITTSATYRQSSQVTPTLLERDPFNRLLARGPRFRVDGEVVRDIALAASGLLNRKLGGPSVYPPAPGFLFVPPASYGPKNWFEDVGPNRYRRAVYTFRFRSVPYPVLQTFDVPAGDVSCVRRVRSNTPLQALATLNEPLFIECAQTLAFRTIEGGGLTDRDRLRFAFRTCLSRLPTPDEEHELLSMLERQRRRFEHRELDAWEVAARDPSRPPTLPPEVNAAQLAAWTTVVRVLLNLDETISKE